MKFNNIILSLAITTLSLNALVITTGAPKSGINILADCLKALLHTKNSASIKGDMVLDAAQMQKYAILVGTPVYNEHNVDLIEKYQAKMIYMIRDPRDLVISMAEKIHTFRKLIAAARNKNMPQIIHELITNGSAYYSYLYDYQEVQQVNGIDNLYSFWLPWAEHKQALTVRFEHLSGAHGQQAQINAIMKIANHINVACTSQQAQKIAESLQSGGMFGLFKKKPSINTWRKHFTAQHKQAFKNIAGPLLIDLGYEQQYNW